MLNLPQFTCRERYYYHCIEEKEAENRLVTHHRSYMWQVPSPDKSRSLTPESSLSSMLCCHLIKTQPSFGPPAKPWAYIHPSSYLIFLVHMNFCPCLVFLLIPPRVKHSFVASFSYPCSCFGILNLCIFQDFVLTAFSGILSMVKAWRVSFTQKTPNL